MRLRRVRHWLCPLLATTSLALAPVATASAAASGAAIVGIATAPDGDGHWVATADGAVHALGGAPALGSLAGQRLAAPIVGIAAAPGGPGYWLVASDGGIFTFGSARFQGSTGAIRLNQPVVGMAASADGGGYWLVARDGGVFSFGSARFAGSTGAVSLNQPIVGMAADPDGSGYWLVAADGGIFAFGAPYLGSTGDIALRSPVTGMAPAPGGDGYWLVAGDGGVFTFSTPFLGAAAGEALGGPIVGIAATPSGRGYRLAGADGRVRSYGDATPGGEVGEPTLVVEEVVRGLTIPWDAGLTPDGTLVWTERAGRLRARTRDGVVTTVGAPSDVFVSGESGLLGLAVDPDFEENRRLYVCQAWTDGQGRDVRVHAWTLAADGRSALRLGPPLVSGISLGSGRHGGCRPEVGPDGALWIGTGDAAIAANPQDERSLAGKVLRVDRFTGAAAPGNPGGDLDPRIFTLGHRNVQGLAFRPGSGQALSIEHGPERDDEITPLRAGGNSGWAPRAPYDEAVPMTDLRAFPDAMRPAWASGTPAVAPSGGTFLTGPQWRAWEGALAVAFLKGSELRLFFLDDAGGLVRTLTILSGRGRLRSVDHGPDGALYVTTSDGGGNDEILRLTPR